MIVYRQPHSYLIINDIIVHVPPNFFKYIFCRSVNIWQISNNRQYFFFEKILNFRIYYVKHPSLNLENTELWIVANSFFIF